MPECRRDLAGSECRDREIIVKITPRMYRAISVVALPLASLYLMWRSRRQPAYRQFWDERFAWGTFPLKTDRPRVWIHAVSVGETNAARPLVEAMLNCWPECDILLTHMTPTGRETGEKLVALAPDRIHQCYLPYDAPYAVEKFFRQTRPTIGVIMETEVWPNVMEEAKRLGIPMVLANARESEKSRAQAAKAIDLMRPAFGSFSAILAQSEEDKRRLESLGGRNISVCGSVKFDIRPNVSQIASAKNWKAKIGRPVILFASTRVGEEVQFTQALINHREITKRASVSQIASAKNWKAKIGRPVILFASTRVGEEVQFTQALINHREITKRASIWMVPRHPERFEEVFNILKDAGFQVCRRSELRDAEDIPEGTEVVLGDSMGEMSFYCALSDMVAMGGSFEPFGSQNVIEPALAGSPIVVGPSTFNFEKIIRDGLVAGAMVQVNRPEEALMQFERWLDDPRSRVEAAHAALDFSQNYAGATQKMMKTLEVLWQKAQKIASLTS